MKNTLEPFKTVFTRSELPATTQALHIVVAATITAQFLAFCHSF